MRTSLAENKTGHPSLGAIASLFFRVGNKTFGSGPATVVLLSREMEDREWLQPWQSDLFYTLARVVPGTNVLAFVAASSHALRGWIGVVVAMSALSIPASVIVVLLTLVYQRWYAHPVGDAIIGGAMSAIVGIIIGAAWMLAAPRFLEGDRIRTLVLVCGAALLSLWLAPLTVMALAAGVGYYWPERK